MNQIMITIHTRLQVKGVAQFHKKKQKNNFCFVTTGKNTKIQVSDWWENNTPGL